MASAAYERLLFNSIKNGQESVRSVYDIWLDLGNTGTPQDFIDSLKGETATVVNNFAIATSYWVSSNGIYKVTITHEEITTESVVNVSFVSTSLDAAINSGVLGYTNTINGGFEMYSNFLPSTDLVINYAIINS